MTDPKDNSSLPLLLSITGAILVVAVGGWFFLEQDTGAPATEETAPVAAVANIPDAEPGPDAAETPLTTDDSAAEAETAAPDPATGFDTDAELRKARLAADADIHIFPREQSALYYYGRVLDADPRNEIARAELDAMLAEVAQTVAQHMAAEEYDSAFEIATLVATQRPDHELVVQTQQTLDRYTEELVEQALADSRNGDDEAAQTALAAAAALPGRNPDYFTAIRDSIAEIQTARLAAEQDRAERARLAEDEARAAWVTRIQTEIEAGNLITPPGASARDLLAESNAWEAERAQMSEALTTALADGTAELITSGSLGEAENLLSALGEMSPDLQTLPALRNALDDAFVERKSSSVAQMTELVTLQSAPPRYPRRAIERNMSGWVDVYFTVTETGDTADVVVQSSEPRLVFDRAAIEAVEKWKFQPVEYRGRVINQRAGTRLVFQVD